MGKWIIRFGRCSLLSAFIDIPCFICHDSHENDDDGSTLEFWGKEDYNKEGQATMTIVMMMTGIRRFTNSCCTNFHWHDDDDDDADDNKLFHTIFQ